MTDVEQLIKKLSGTTKAQIIVNEFLIGNLDIASLKAIFDCLADSDLEKIGMVELIKKEAELQEMDEDSKNSLLGALTAAGNQAEIPLVKKERKTITVKPFKAPDTDHFSNKPPAPPPLFPGQGKRSGKNTSVSKKISIKSSESTQTQKINNDMYFGESAGAINNNIDTFHKPRILIADDDPRIRMIFRMKIQGAGYSIIEAENGDMAWQLLNEKKPDGLVMDMKMPGLHGLEILAKLTQLPEKPPVCVCSAYDQLQDEYVIKNYPDLRYFVKPVDADELLKAVGEMVPIES
ncbi:MAG: response regulator [Planctomycetota bacterium]|jgi:CheY-like chemotaxis protein